MKKVLVIIILCLIVLVLILCKVVVNSRSNLPIDECDTIINTIRIDSIEYNIIKKDTIIYNIKKIQKHEIEKTKYITDSASVELFKQLVSE